LERLISASNSTGGRFELAKIVEKYHLALERWEKAFKKEKASI
jgi:hypothetical protein